MDIVELFGEGTILISDLVINILLGTVLSLGLAAYYVRFGQTYSDRTSHARILPILAITTLLVITVVKSSLALSLGLVGALSIVRFRTPIKEPEELAYLFLAIAIGLGLGANQRIATLVAVPLILVMLLIPITWRRTRTRQNTFMILSVPSSNTARETLAMIIKLMQEHATKVDLRRMEVRGEKLEATLYVAAKSSEGIAEMVDVVRSSIPDAQIAFIEQEPGLG